jgi:hypothetical protein
VTDARNARHSIRVAFSEPTAVPKDWYRNARTQVRVAFGDPHTTSARLIGGFEVRVLSGPWGGNADLTHFGVQVLSQVVEPAAVVKIFDGGEWVDAPVKLWDGTQWVNALAVKTWNGTEWVEPG